MSEYTRENLAKLIASDTRGKVTDRNSVVFVGEGNTKFEIDVNGVDDFELALDFTVLPPKNPENSVAQMTTSLNSVLQFHYPNRVVITAMFGNKEIHYNPNKYQLEGATGLSEDDFTEWQVYVFNILRKVEYEDKTYIDEYISNILYELIEGGRNQLEMIEGKLRAIGLSVK